MNLCLNSWIYNIIRWFAGTNEPSTECPMFQVSFSFYKFAKIKVKSFECPKSIRNYKKNNAWNIGCWSQQTSEPAYYIVDWQFFFFGKSGFEGVSGIVSKFAKPVTPPTFWPNWPVWELLRPDQQAGTFEQKEYKCNIIHTIAQRCVLSVSILVDLL